MPEEQRRKLSLSMMGKSAWNKGKKRPPFSFEWRHRMSLGHRGKSSGKLGKPHREDVKKRMRAASLRMWQERRNGTRAMPAGRKIRTSKRVRFSHKVNAWRIAVFQRDKYRCVFCGAKSKDIEADHIKRWITHPRLRYDVSNGRTLCRPCHVLRHRPKPKQLTFLRSDGQINSWWLKEVWLT